MVGHQNVRFIGGTWNNQFKSVAPSTNEIGTSMVVEPERRKGEFKKGDKVRVVRGSWDKAALPKGSIQTVVAAFTKYGQAYVAFTEEHAKTDNGWDANRFELVEAAPSVPARAPAGPWGDFQVGDEIELTQDYFRVRAGTRHKVEGQTSDLMPWFTSPVDANRLYFSDKYAKLVSKVGVPCKYTRRRLSLLGDTSRYEEVCFALDSMSNAEATKALWQALTTPGSTGVTIPPPLKDTVKLPVRESKLIEAIGYLEDGGLLDVTFKDKSGDESGTYRYSNVSPTLVTRLLTAPSLGAFYVANLRNKYPCQKL
jgi:hypothetical protein